MPDDRFSLRIYRRLIRLYPAGFRDNYAEALERAFRDELAESSGWGSQTLLWLRLLADLALSLPAQLASEFVQDARHAVRLWAQRPWHTGFAIFALAIGIGANVGVFSVVNALLLRSLPFREPERLAALRQFFPPYDSTAHFHDWRTHSEYLSDAALFEMRAANLGSSGEWRRVMVSQTSWNFFDLLGTRPVIGRSFVAGEDVDAPGWGLPGPNAVVVIGYSLWQEMFGGDRRALGATIRLDGIPMTVIGVAPPGFDYPAQSAVWKPAAYSGGNFGWSVIARLKPGITWPQARVPFAAEAERLSPTRGRTIGKTPELSVLSPLRDELAGPSKNASLALMGCVALILLIACTNVANLLMARTADRAPELSIRSAMGASRARLAQQLLTECLLLSVMAAAVGMLVAYAATSIAANLQPAPLATQAYSLLDMRVLGFAIAVSIVSALLFGGLPSLYAGRIHRFAARGSADTRSSRLMREVLVGVQVALTIALLAGSISLGHAFTGLMKVDRGFDRSNVVTANVSLQGTIHQGAAGLAYFQGAVDRVRRLPGVRSASFTEFLPLYATGFVGSRQRLDGRMASRSSMSVPVLADYFRTMGGRIVAGREITDAEVREHARVTVVNDVFAREFGQPQELLGREISNGGRPRRIVGVVKGMDYMVEGANTSQIFVPAETPGDFFSTIVVKVDGRPEDRLAAIRDTIRSVDPQVPVFGVKTMEQRMSDALARPQFYRTAVLCLAGFALSLAIVGIYGIVSYSIARRTHEMGVRMALGSTSGRLRGYVLRQGMLPIAVGAIPGVIWAALSGKLLENLVEGARSVSISALTAALLVIAVSAAAGIWVATRAITRLDIADVLRSE